VKQPTVHIAEKKSPVTRRVMSAKRRIADFLIIGCGLCRLHDTRLQSAIRAVLDEIDLQHLRDSYPCPSFEDRSEFYEFVQSSVIGDEPIDFLEFGVFQGDSIREWSLMNQHSGSRFYGFDSFEGLPDAWRKGQGRGHFNMQGTMPEIADARVKLIKGWFDETVPDFLREFTPKNRVVVHLDADLYSSTLGPLIHLGRYLQAGSLLIFDEFYDRNHEFKAFQDFLKISRHRYRLIGQMENYAKVCIALL
jgi:O-methyltransferase